MTQIVAQPPAARPLGVLLAPDLDYRFLGAVLALLAFGLVAVTSASLHLQPDAPFVYAKRHLLTIVLGLGGALIVFILPTDWWRRLSIPLFVTALVFLGLVLIPALGKEVNGARRWLQLTSSFSFQSSELMKLAAILFIAAYLARWREEIYRNTRVFLVPLFWVGLAVLLIVVEPDFGTSAVILATALGMLFLGGAPLRHFFILFLLVLAAMWALVVFSPYRWERVTSFVDPWADVNDSGYQLSQALIAIGRGEWFGVGLGDGIQKQYYLPEAHTDFVLAVVGEELGLAGILLAVGLLAVVVQRAFAIGARAIERGRWFEGFMAQGVGLWLALQSLVNVGVNVGLLPTKGLTLPLMSFGGNSIIVACCMLALVLRVDRDNRMIIGAPSREAKPWAHG